MKSDFCLAFVFMACFGFTSCGSKYKKYHADYIVTELEIYTDVPDYYVLSRNFDINVRNKTSAPVTIDFGEIGLGPPWYDIELFSKKGKDYILFKGHKFFKGPYELRCLDENCCEVEVKDSTVYIKMVYNSELPYGRIDKCDY